MSVKIEGRKRSSCTAPPPSPTSACSPAGVGLHVDPPLGGVQAERSQRTVLANELDAVNELVAAVVPRVGLALRVLVGQAGAQGLHDGCGREVLAGNELNALPACVCVVFACFEWRMRMAHYAAGIRTETDTGTGKLRSLTASHEEGGEREGEARATSQQNCQSHAYSPLPDLLLLDDVVHLWVRVAQGAVGLREHFIHGSIFSGGVAVLGVAVHVGLGVEN